MEKISVIDSRSFNKLSDIHSPFILVVHKGEPIIETILNCARALKLNSASLSGLGALENPTIAYFNLGKRTYQDKIFSGIFELISLIGNIAQFEGNYVPHIHVTLGDEQYQVFGGHLQNAIVGVTAEITITPLAGSLIRQLHPDIGAKLIQVQ